MKLIDITRVVQDAPLYPGNDPVRYTKLCDMALGDVYNATFIEIGAHLGTHADGIGHFIDGGTSVEAMPLEHYIGECRVMSVAAEALLTKEDFEGRIDGVVRLVLKGGGKSYLSKDAADYLVSSGIKTIVTDAWSVAPMDNEPQIHIILLSAGIAIVENVILDGVQDGTYFLSSAPVAYGGCDGAPVRAVLIDWEESPHKA